MACDLKPIGQGADACTESYAGTGTIAYLFFSEDVDTTGLTIDDKSAAYKGFALKESKKIYPIRLKKQANKVACSSLGDNKGFSNVGTIVVDKDLANMALNARTINNKPCGLLLMQADTTKGPYVLWNQVVDTKFELSSDTGDSYDADSGYTYTVTAAPMPYPDMTIGAEDFAALTVDTGAAAG